MAADEPMCLGTQAAHREYHFVSATKDAQKDQTRTSFPTPYGQLGLIFALPD